jgi:hypothetical protein
MGGCEVERYFGTPAIYRFSLDGRDQRIMVLKSLLKFSSR